MDLYKNGERPLIALFDSGIGGLSLLKECTVKMPQADFCYFADNYNMPYGNLSEREIKERVFCIFDKITKINPLVAVVACNTVTSCCIKELRKKYFFPIAGVQPAIKQAAEYGGKFLVLSTKATAESLSFKQLLSDYGENAEIHVSPDLAGKIEENIFSLENFEAEGLPQKNYSSVVLGCTHYVFIADKIKKLYGCPVFDGISGTADHVAKISGIFDHQAEGHQKILFSKGDFEKNEAVFRHICR